MLGNCLIRNPLTVERKLDTGALCEALLFFSKTHVVLDQATLAQFVTAGFLMISSKCSRGDTSQLVMRQKVPLSTQTIKAD